MKELEKPVWQSAEVLIPAAAPVATGVGTFLSGAAPIVAITLILVVADEMRGGRNGSSR